MAVNAVAQQGDAGGAFAPLREPAFRRIWASSFISNFGQLILGVGAAWEMTRLADSPSMVALVQTALMLPLMLVALPAGALADMFDRRKIAMTGLSISILCSLALTALAYFELTTPWILLAFCFLIGGGVALYAPSWQASIGEQVSQQHLPAAIALGSISYNVTRSFGPAIGGLIVMAFGAQAAFGVNALGYIPLWIAFLLWQRPYVPPRLPPERLDRAISSGMRYVRHSPPLRTVLTRVFLYSVACASSAALLPLVAKNLLSGDASTFGVMLGASGIGAVGGALLVRLMRERFDQEIVIRVCTVFTAVGLIGVGYSRTLPLTCLALSLTGLCNILSYSMLNVTVQMVAPRWVTARALSLYSSSLTGGIAIGSWMWGMVADRTDVTTAFLISGLAVGCTLIIGLLLPLAKSDAESGNDLVKLGSEPEVALDVTMRSGPVLVEVEYDVDPEQARTFYAALTELEEVRKRIGGFDWSVARNIADPAIWIERYSCPTWGDYLRMRDRYTQSDLDLQHAVDGFNRKRGERRVKRFLERPHGSVRASADTPDTFRETMDFIAP